MKFQEFHENQEFLENGHRLSPACKNTNETYAFLMILEVIFHKIRTFRKKGQNSKFGRTCPKSQNFMKFGDFHHFLVFWGPWAPHVQHFC